MTSFGVIATAGLLAGALDLAASSTLMKTRGISLEQLLQTICSGALGPSAYKGGKKTATGGVFFHFLIALVAAAIYYTISRQWNPLLSHPWLSGITYGIAVHLVMSLVVVPLSSAPKRKFSAQAFLIQLVIHILFVGLPIALTVSHLSR
jgi:Na+-driven multidrug efflux pump